MKLILVATVLATLSVSGVHAQQWKQETAAVMGVQLGGTLASLNLPLCAKDARPRGDEICYMPHPISPSSGGSLFQTPALGFDYAAAVNLSGGSVEHIDLNVPHHEFEKAIAVLTERYGPVTSQVSYPVTTLAGASFSSRALTWTGSRMSIVAVERAGELDWSKIRFIDKALQEKKSADAAAARKEGASKL